MKCPVCGKDQLTRARAIAIAKRMRQQDKRVGEYPCPEGKGWHVGTQYGRRKRWRKRPRR